MTETVDSEQTRDSRRVILPYLVLIMAALAAIVSTYFLGNSELDVAAKTRGFSGIIAVFLIFCVCLHLWQSRRNQPAEPEEATVPNEANVEQCLFVLEEAGKFFAGSLKSADMFRLVANRVRDLLPFKSLVLYLLDGTRTQLRVAESEGSETGEHKDQTIGFDDGLAGQSYSSRQIEVDSYLSLDATQDLGSSVAIPLYHGTGVFGVLQLCFDAEFDMEKADRSVFEAVGTRVAPLMLTSIAFERSQANALTDITTDLPNERAFYLILENQIVEAQRKPDDQPLTVLAIDIKNFDDINQRFGHAAGDSVLNFVAQIVKDNLRQMDFLARSIGDEFLAVLPTASKEVSHEIIARIHTGFFERKLKISDTDSIEIELNVGWAVFGSDGETPGQLLSFAQLRKEQSKSVEANKVLWFSREMVN